MKFEEALIELKKGKRITIRSFVYDPGWKEYTFNFNDIMSFEWEIYNPGKSFNEVFEEFKQGKKIRRKSWDIFNHISLNTNTKVIYRDDLIASDWEVIE